MINIILALTASVLADNRMRGSGVIVYVDQKKTVLVTDAHVINRSKNFKISTMHGVCKAKVSYKGKKVDFAVLVAENCNHLVKFKPKVSIATYYDVRDKIVLYGKRTNSITYGSIVEKNMEACPAHVPQDNITYWTQCLTTNTWQRRGDSGGGCWNERGELIGLIYTIQINPYNRSRTNLPQCTDFTRDMRPLVFKAIKRAIRENL